MSRNRLAEARRVVVKVGSQVLTGPDGRLDRRVFEMLADDIAAARRRGVEVVLVSSGAVAAGMGRLGLERRPDTIPEVQALAAVGQIHLVGLYEEVFRPHGIPVGQVLLTRDDLDSRRRYQNAKTALLALLRLGAVPVINENDTVVVEELKFGDNDNLSALVTNLVEADALVILSDIEGLFDRDPKVHPDARLVERVDRVDETVERFVGRSRSRVGTGGMATKLVAAQRATHGGAAVAIASGKAPHALRRILAGEPLGTFFAPQADRLRRRKHWIAYTVQPVGRIRVDAGAVRALVEGGKSLLPKGVVGVEGPFERGDAVVVEGPDGEEVARGLVAYSAEEVREIAGLASWEIADRLGYTFGDEVIHRDDLVVFREPAFGAGAPAGSEKRE
ncbi:MAG: glutamate 5-kinase [Candidatus Dadabacteria bacterium]|nr:MAG: glutamate 5-kinase [Candidatus Dadabacteria bacterium]